MLPKVSKDFNHKMNLKYNVIVELFLEVLQRNHCDTPYYRQFTICNMHHPSSLKVTQQPMNKQTTTNANPPGVSRIDSLLQQYRRLSMTYVYIAPTFHDQQAQLPLGLSGRIVIASGKSELKSPASSCASA
jgi:hypothetical protein